MGGSLDEFFSNRLHAAVQPAPVGLGPRILGSSSAQLFIKVVHDYLWQKWRARFHQNGEFQIQRIFKFRSFVLADIKPN